VWSTDIVVAGHDRSEIGFPVIPNLQGCRSICGELEKETLALQVLQHSNVKIRVLEGLAALHGESAASSTHATRALISREPLSIDQGEITDKGYINQRAILIRRAVEVEQLYSPSDPDVVRLRV
jgi:feruloyl-CoA synthase